MFKFDLQLFGGGGGGGGKSTGKLIGSIAFGFISAGFSFFGGGISGLARFAMGASLFSSVWTATHQQKNDSNLDPSNIQRFDREQETMSSTGALPVVYGQRKLTGNQTFHDTNADANTLHKHVVLCEGGIEGVDSVCANDLLIPTGSQAIATVFTIQNVAYADATVSKSGKTMTITANGQSKSLYLCNKDDGQNGETYWSWQTSVPGLITYLNQLGEGWQAFPTATTSMYPGDISIGSGNCYKNPIDATASTVTGGTSFTFHDSTPPDNYETVGAYTDMAWLDMHFIVSNELNGNPSVSCVVKGRKVYDTRTGKTAYSTNPAMCLRDFLLSPRYGLGKWFTANDLDDDSWNESADYCDEIITFHDSGGVKVTAKRYELNMVIDEQKSALEWLQQILANFAGFIVYSNGKLKLCIEKPTVISYRFNDDNCSDLKIEPMNLTDTPNRYEVSIVDPLNNWNTIKAICEDYADQKMRQRIITKAVSLEGVTSQSQALRLARFYRDYNLVCPLQLSFTTGMQGMSLEPGDVVTLSYHGVFTDMPIRIATIKETNKGTFEISGRQYNDTIYGDDLGGGIHWYNYATMPTPYAGDISNVYNYVVSQEYYVQSNGTSVSRVNLSYSLPRGNYFSHTMIDYSIDNGTTWVVAGESYGTTFSFPVVIGQTYLIRTRVVNTVGRMSSGVVSAAMYITGKNNPPSDVSYLSLVQDGTNIVASILLVSDPDIDHYQLRMGAIWETATKIGDFTGTSYSFPATQDGTCSYLVKAIDTSGNESNTAKRQVINITNVPVSNVIYNHSFDISKFDSWQNLYEYGNALYTLDSRHISDFALFEDIFGQLNYLEGSVYLPVIDLGENVIDPSCFWIDSTGMIHQQEIKKISDYALFADMFTGGGALVAPVSLASTFLGVDVDGSDNDDIKTSVEYRTSIDGNTFTDWTPDVQAIFRGRFVQIRVNLQSASGHTQGSIKGVTVKIDVPDVDVTLENIDLIAGDNYVPYGHYFMEVPSSVAAFTVDGAGKSAAYQITAKDTKGFTIRLYDDNNGLIGGKIVRGFVRGY